VSLETAGRNRVAKRIPDNIDIVKAMDQLLKNPRVAFSPEAVRRVRDEVVAMRALKDQVEGVIRELGEANAALATRISSLQKDIESLQEACADKDDQISDLQDLLVRKTAELGSLALELDALIDAAALQAVAKQMSSMSGLDDLVLGSLGDEANEMLKRLSGREARDA